MNEYVLTVEGTDAQGNTWKTEQEVQVIYGDFLTAFGDGMQRSFDTLTSGKAIYGNPGVGGCRGPYKINRITMERKDDANINPN